MIQPNIQTGSMCGVRAAILPATLSPGWLRPPPPPRERPSGRRQTPAAVPRGRGLGAAASLPRTPIPEEETTGSDSVDVEGHLY